MSEDTATMDPKREYLILAGICLFMMLLSLAGLVWAFFAGLLWPQIDMDGLLLALVCLTLAGVFQLLFFHLAKLAGWFDAWALPGKLFRRKQAAKSDAGSEAPAAKSE
jgi:hypothetical protein